MNEIVEAKISKEKVVSLNMIVLMGSWIFCHQFGPSPLRKKLYFRRYELRYQTNMLKNHMYNE